MTSHTFSDLSDRRRWRHGAALVATALIVAGCFASGGPRPGDQVSLESTTWQVQQIGDQQPTGGALPTIRFEAYVDGDSSVRASVITECATLDGYYDGDTDGDALGFWGFERPKPSASATVTPATPCPTADQEQGLVDALLTVESWSVTNDDEIVLHGNLI